MSYDLYTSFSSLLLCEMKHVMDLKQGGMHGWIVQINISYITKKEKLKNFWRKTGDFTKGSQNYECKMVVEALKV